MGFKLHFAVMHPGQRRVENPSLYYKAESLFVCLFVCLFFNSSLIFQPTELKFLPVRSTRGF